MINEKDIYSHLAHGGNPQDLLDAFMKELNETQKKVDEDKKAQAEAAKKQKKVDTARKTAVAALLDYFSLVNPSVTEQMITSVLSTLESVKISNKKGSISGNLFDIINVLL